MKGSTPGVLEVYPPGVAILGINGARDVVGEQWDADIGKFRGYYRHAATGQEVLIDAPCGRDTTIMDVNLASTLATVQCGQFDETEIPPRSYAFNGETWTELTFPGSPYTLVHRVNNAGQFVGSYLDPDPMRDLVMHGFIATPVLGQPIAQR